MRFTKIKNRSELQIIKIQLVMKLANYSTIPKFGEWNLNFTILQRKFSTKNIAEHLMTRLKYFPNSIILIK